jgi:hypothetical protein
LRKQLLPPEGVALAACLQIALERLALVGRDLLFQLLF